MVFPPSKEAYEALVNEVTALKEENKRLLKDTTTSEVELQPKTSKASRNSWAEIYQETTTLRKHKRLFGQEVKTDDGLEWRIKWGQRGVGVFGLFTTICYVAEQWNATAVFGVLSLIFAGVLYYKNVSLVIAKRLVREPNVVMLLVFGLCNWGIHIARPHNAFSPVNGFLYMLVVSAFVFLDAVKTKSRVFLIAVGILFVLINVNNIYHLIFGN